MPTSTISNTILDPSGNPVAGVPVKARLRPVSSGIRVDVQSELSGIFTTESDANGHWEMELERNGNLTPANTYWEIEERVPRTKGGTRTHAIVVGAVDATVAASGIATSPETQPPVFLTLEAADARYLRNGEVSVVGTQTTFIEDVFFKGGRPQYDAKAFGAVEDGVTDDRIFIQSAINLARAMGGGDVVIGNSKVSSNHPTVTATLPRDDGTIPAGAPIAAEPVVTIPVQLVLPGYVKLKGISGKLPSKLIGTWDHATVNLVQPVLVWLEDADIATYINDAGIENLTIQDAFIGIGAFTANIVVDCELSNLLFTGCAIPSLTDKIERTKLTNIRMENSYAGIVHGGMWGQRYNGPGEFSWADKSSIKHIGVNGFAFSSGAAGVMAVAAAIDTYYDTYFFKTANNATRGGAGVYFNNLPYRGITGIAVCMMNRYGRASIVTDIHHVFSRGGRRSVVQFDQPAGGTIEFIHAEDFGWITSATHTGVWGVTQADPIVGTKSRGIVDIKGVQPLSIDIHSVMPNSVNALKTLNLPDSDAISWSEIRALNGAGAIDTPQIGNQFYGRITSGDIRVGSLKLGNVIASRDDTDVEVSVNTYRATHAPGIAFQNKTWVGSDFVPPVGPLYTGLYEMSFYAERGDDRKLVGKRQISFAKHGAFSATDKSVDVIGTDKYDLLNAQGLVVTIDDEGVLTFAYTSNYNSTQPVNLRIRLDRLVGEF